MQHTQHTAHHSIFMCNLSTVVMHLCNASIITIQFKETLTVTMINHDNVLFLLRQGVSASTISSLFTSCVLSLSCTGDK